ncbi:MAG: 50S ribosomal protein L18 [Candidatus Daviesbacteria bacterium]|nr:50S ribosomal protein L18 [Candidatus Daviesbacteria bacterium]
MIKDLRINKHKKIRKKIMGIKDCPRLAVFRSSQHIYAQIVDDSQGKTLVAGSDLKETGTKKEKALKVGKALAKKALNKKITRVVFDRGGFLYQGRVAELAKGAREGGLKF